MWGVRGHFSAWAQFGVWRLASAFAKATARQVFAFGVWRPPSFRLRQGYGATGFRVWVWRSPSFRQGRIRRDKYSRFGAPAAAVAETPKQVSIKMGNESFECFAGFHPGKTVENGRKPDQIGVSRLVERKRIVLCAKSWYASIIRTVLVLARIRIEWVIAV